MQTIQNMSTTKEHTDESPEEQIARLTEELKLAKRRMRSARNQLIIQRKLASLGQLTAGIAHEIKNPLNFINNFADMNVELIAELKTDVVGNDELSIEEKWEEAKELLDMIASNSSKIVDHGQRADKTIQGMLLHSRSDGGIKEDTDIVEWTKENLELVVTAQNKKVKFKGVSLELDFPDEAIVVPLIKQDFGRVIINLVRNAYHAVNSRSKKAADDFQPTVSSKIYQDEQWVYVCIRDNGVGIPEENLVRIFEPFFTTKKAGAGNTGLGLSISHDVIEKMHGGKFTVTSKVGEFTEFMIQLPLLKKS